MPYSLSEEQIDFILNDIKVRGIEIEKLQINLLDHICCLLEEKMNEGDDFEACYKRTIEEFHENNLSELEKETKGLLRSKHYYTIKNTLYIVLVASISYNIYAGTKLILGYFEIQTYAFETHSKEGKLKESISLNQHYNDLKRKLHEEYPYTDLKEISCVIFPKDPSFFEFEYHELDTFNHYWDTNNDQLFRNLDALAKKYNEQLNIIIAFQRTDKIIDKAIYESQSKTKNLLYLKGMHQLYFACDKELKNQMEIYPGVVVFNKEGKIIYYNGQAGEKVYFLLQFLKTLPPK